MLLKKPESIAGIILFQREGSKCIAKAMGTDVIKNADWIIDLGPGAGDEGGYVVATGTPEQIAANEDSLTVRYLKRVV